VQGEGVTAERIYEAYPRKTARQDAIKAISKAMQQCPPDKLLTSTQLYADAVAKWEEYDRKFVPHPATWYNRGSYEDDPATWVRGEQPANTPRDKTRAAFA
jgi:hypothetical protein